METHRLARALPGRADRPRLSAHRSADVDARSRRAAADLLRRRRRRRGLSKALLWIVFVGVASLNSTVWRREQRHAPPDRRLPAHAAVDVAAPSRTRSRPAASGGTASCSPACPTGASCCACPRRSSRAEEQAFLDGPCEELCRMLDDWQITHELLDMPPEVWAVPQRAEVLRDDHPEEATAASGSRRSRARWCSRSCRRATRRRLVDDRRAELPRPGRAAAALRHRRAEAVLAAAARVAATRCRASR